MKIKEAPKTKKEYKIVKTKDIFEIDLAKEGKNLQALFINVLWKSYDIPDGITISQFEKLNIPSELISNGIIFIWSEKKILSKLIHLMEKKNFHYVENCAIARLDLKKFDNKTDEEEVVDLL